LARKEQIEISAVIAKVTGLADQANTAIGDLRVKADGALDAITATVNNANGVVTGIRRGKGTMGMLLNDKQTADDVKGTVANARQASINLNKASLQATAVIADFQSRNLFQKAGDTLDSAKNAAGQLDQSSQQVNAMLNEARAPEPSGENAAENLRESLSNINTTTANIADDTEALKHEFFFKGFFKTRGFYSLQDLSPQQYRTNAYFQNHSHQRAWLAAGEAFATDSNGKEFLSTAGKQQIDQIVGSLKDSVVDQSIVVEGYSNQASPANQIALSRARSLLVAHYLETRFHLYAKNIGVMPLNNSAPSYSGKSTWDGACIVLLGKQ
jgi:phospholipid/cholesterol/gamma-HCH transport system substrate-binding protein